MKNLIIINQQAIVNNGFDLDLTDAAILDWFFFFQQSGKMKKIVDQEQDFFWVQYQKVISDMPMLSAKTKDGIYRRFKKLSDMGFVIPHPGNQAHGNSFYRINQELFYRINFSSDPPDNNPEGYGRPSGRSALDPTESFPDNKGISSYKGINDKDNGQSPEIKKSPEEKLQEKKADFFRKVFNFVKANPRKYPKLLYLEFCRYWTEKSQGGQKMRFEGEKYFDLGRRLSTWFQSKICQEKLSSFWEKENEIPGIDKLLKEELEKK